MEKIITDELTKYLIVLGGAVVALFVVITKLITKFKGAFKPYKKQTIIYLLTGLLLFAFIAVLAFPSVIQKPFTAFIIFQLCFLFLGSAHVYELQHQIRWANTDNSFLPEMLFTILVSVFGCVGFLLMYRLVNKNGLEFIMAGSILCFIIPFFFYQTFLKAISVPPKVLKEWFYPLHQEMEEPDESKLKNLLVISFEFKKHLYETSVTNFRAKAPVDMDFGQLFYYFINDYNERHPDSKIQFVNGDGEPNGWIFYKKHRWNTLITKYVDADKTIFNNHIKENDVIICNRSLV